MATLIFTLLVEANEKQYITPAEFVAICCGCWLYIGDINPEPLLRYEYIGDCHRLVDSISQPLGRILNDDRFNDIESFKYAINRRLV